MHVERLNRPPLLGSSPLADAICMGRDFAGFVVFEDLAYVINNGRHELLSVHRLDETDAEESSIYEVVLKAKY